MSTTILPQGFFAGWETLLLGAITGLVFGFLLQKGGVTRADVIINQFLLRDFTVLKIMLTAIVVGGAGVYALFGMGAIESLHIKNATIWGNLVGGGIFGVGMAILGYCPGTGVAAIGDGSRDAIPGVIGMVVGATLFAETYPWFNESLLKPLDLGKQTLATITGISPWAYLVVLTIISIVLFKWFDQLEGRHMKEA
ncbi:MAG TPA: YeeE/YedE thiosulfate transporter family protein [Candidatus Binatia bacterium]|jgi:uncharacterized membrane protein YedE/YeeE